MVLLPYIVIYLIISVRSTLFCVDSVGESSDIKLDNPFKQLHQINSAGSDVQIKFPTTLDEWPGEFGIINSSAIRYLPVRWTHLCTSMKVGLWKHHYTLLVWSGIHSPWHLPGLHSCNAAPGSISQPWFYWPFFISTPMGHRILYKIK